MKPFLSLFILLTTCVQMHAQVIRLYATATRYYSIPYNAATASTDSVDYYYSGDKGLSTQNGNFIADIIAYYTKGKKTHYYEKKYNSFDEETLTEDFNYPAKTTTITSYDNNNRKQSVYNYTDYGQGSSSNSLYTYTYDGTGNLIEVKARNQQSQSPPNWFFINNTYDASNNIVAETEQYWDSITNVYMPSRRYLYTYNSQNQCTEKKQQLWNNNQWKENSRMTHTYDVAGNINEIIHEAYQNNAWMLLGKTTSTYNGVNKIQEKQTFDWINNNYLLSTKNIWSYTSFNQPQSYEYIRYTTDTTYHHYTWYYYGVHWLLGISAPKSADKEIAIYPNPASNFITIQSNKKDLQPFSISIYDIHGKVLKQWYEPLKSQEYTIQVHDLPSGSYLLKFKGRTYEAEEPFIIAR